MGFLVRDDGSKFTILDRYLWTHTYTKSGPKTAEHEKVGYEPWDLERETTEILRALQIPEDKDGLPRRLFERLAEPAELFVWARACAAQGKSKRAAELFFQAKRTADGRGEAFHHVIADAIAHGQMWQAVNAFGDPGTISRKDLLVRFELIVKNFPESPHFKQAKETVDLLTKMVAEDEAHALKAAKPVEKMTRQERIAELIFRLRDQNGRQFSQPGHCDIFIQDHLKENKNQKSPALQLVEIGYAAVPELIQALTDDHFSRSVGYHRDFYFSHFVLRVGDCAEAVLERIAGRTFWEPKSSSAAMLKDGQVNIVKAKVQAWWQDFQERGEKQILIEGVQSGDYDSPNQAKRLMKKYPESALSAIRQGVKTANKYFVVRDLVKISTDLKGDTTTEFLREELNGSFLSGRVTAARGLLDRGHNEGIDAMIREWNHTGKDEPQEDLIDFLLWCGKAEAIKSLGRDLRRRPVDISLQVIETIQSPGWGWENYQKSLAPEVDSAIDEILVGELDDSRERANMSGTWGGKEVHDPRLCDLSAHVLAQRWKHPEAFDITATEEVRDRQRKQLKNEWLNKRRKP
jgi:hypothetical protein